MDLSKFIRDVPDFPKKGIIFKDITPLLQNGEALRVAVDRLVEPLGDDGFDLVAGIESRGFIFGAAVACKAGVGFTMVRKRGKLPWRTHSESYDLEYGKDEVEIHQDAVHEGSRVLLVDDLIATGGTAEATARLIERQGGTIVGCHFLVELEFLGGRKRLEPRTVRSLIHYNND